MWDSSPDADASWCTKERKFTACLEKNWKVKKKERLIKKV